MLCKRNFIYTHCFGLYEYSWLYSFETLYLFNSKGQYFRREKLMQGKWVNYSSKNKYCFETLFYTCVFNIYINQPPVGQCVPTMGSYHQKKKKKSKSLCLLLFSHSEREKSQKGECISLSSKNELFWHLHWLSEAFNTWITQLPATVFNSNPSAWWPPKFLTFSFIC